MCLPVYYERLVLQPKQQMQRILKFLGITWHENVIHHEQAIGVKGGISLSKYVFINNRYNMLVNLCGFISALDIMYWLQLNQGFKIRTPLVVEV